MSSNNESISSIGRFKIKTVSMDNLSKQYLMDDSTYVCLLPFTRTSDNNIKAVHLLEYTDPTDDQVKTSLIIDSIDSDLDRTSYDSVKRSMIEEAGVNLDDLKIDENSIYYLGEITSTVPGKVELKCYAIDLTDLKNPIEFTRVLTKDGFVRDRSKVVEVGFHKVVNGDYSDSLVLSAAFLLVSYFN